ncbi:hypothetical protein ACJX0J_014163 [Zea mays]
MCCLDIVYPFAVMAQKLIAYNWHYTKLYSQIIYVPVALMGTLFFLTSIYLVDSQDVVATGGIDTNAVFPHFPASCNIVTSITQITTLKNGAFNCSLFKFICLVLHIEMTMLVRGNDFHKLDSLGQIILIWDEKNLCIGYADGPTAQGTDATASFFEVLSKYCQTLLVNVYLRSSFLY